MTRILAFALVALAAAAAAPTAAAGDVTSTVYLHDLLNDEGGYSGCHVVDAKLSSYRLTVTQGDRITLTVKNLENNTNVHSVSVEGVSGSTGHIAPGDSTTMEFVADSAGSREILCDGESRMDLRGLVTVRPSTTDTNEAPAAGVVGVVVAIAAAVATRRRG